MSTITSPCTCVVRLIVLYIHSPIILRSMHINERCRRKEERSKQGHTNKQGKATQYTQGSYFSKKKKSYLGWDSLARPSLGVHMSITRLSPSPDRVASETSLGWDSVHVYMKVESEAKKSYVSYMFMYIHV